MDEITNMPQWSFDLFGYGVTLNTLPLINTWMIMAVLILFGFLATRQTKLVPNPLQSMAEMLIKVFDDMVYDALEVEDYRKYFPLICGLFLFLWLSNIWGIIPFFSEPTKDLNTPLSLGLLGFVVAHYSGIRAKGLKAYLGQYFEPLHFHGPLEHHWRAGQGRIHQLSSIRQHHGWQYHYHCGGSSDIQPGPAAVP
jgi:F-type H+-transporting ATPase subunit a